MKYQAITNRLETASENVPIFITEKWIQVNDQSGDSYRVKKQIRFKTSTMLISSL